MIVSTGARRRKPSSTGPRRSRWRRLTGSLVLAGGLGLGAPPPVAADPADPGIGREGRGGSAPAPLARHEYDESVPLGSVYRYIQAARAGRYEEAARYLDLRGIPPERREETGPVAARHLKVVLDRKLWIDFALLSREPQGHIDDGLPPGFDRIGTIERSTGGPIDVMLERVESASGALAWRFNGSTVEAIPELYDEFGYGALGEWLPRPFFDLGLLGVRLWQWIALVLLAAGAWALAPLVVSAVTQAVRPMVRRTETNADDQILAALIAPARALIALVVFSLGALSLRLAIPVQQSLLDLETALGVLGFIWAASRLIDVAGNVLRERLEREGRRAVTSVIPLGRRAAKLFLFAIAAIALLQNLGFNVTGLIAGLGVGGLALALAAQKTIENLFGGVSLIADQAVRVGDFCKFGEGQIGTIEEIGLRSTRLRTIDRTLITIPNSDFSQRPLENFGARDRIRLLAILGLRYETDPDQLRWILDALRRELIRHPRIAHEDSRARFVGFGASSLDVEVAAYVKTTVWTEFLAVREDVFLRFMEIVRAGGSGFAFPSQTLYLGRDARLDPERASQVVAEVRQWREEGRLPFPEPAPEDVEQIASTGDYPPRGSLAGRTDPAREER